MKYHVFFPLWRKNSVKGKRDQCTELISLADKKLVGMGLGLKWNFKNYFLYQQHFGLFLFSVLDSSGWKTEDFGFPL